MSGIDVGRDGAVATIRLDRPEAFNAFDEEQGAAFLQALDGVKGDDVRAVVITGEGKAFCAGEDLRSLQSGYDAGDPPDHADILRRRYNPSMLAIRTLAKPVIAAINGVAAGAGVSLALACDLRIMSARASMVLGFASVGLVPDSGATWLLPRYVGIGRAYEMAVSGARISAEEALALGLVDQLVDGAELETVVRDRARELAEGPTVALAQIKKLLWDSWGADLAGHLEEEAKAQAIAGGSADHLEGVRAFNEKRPPHFEGR